VRPTLSVTPGLKPTSISQSNGGGGRRSSLDTAMTGSVNAARIRRAAAAGSSASTR